MNNLVLQKTDYAYSEFEYEELDYALKRAEAIAPNDGMYQYRQNQLDKEIARFLLRPYINKKK